MTRLLPLLLLCILATCGLAAQTPQATELPGKPFFIKKTWRIGGEGNWDYMTLDPSALRLYIAHGTVVQVVDVNAGTVAGEVTGLRDSHGIALDSNGQYGYITDGAANEVVVFDRSSFEVVARIPTGKNPRAVVFDPASRLVFAICPGAATENRIPRRASSGQVAHPSSEPFVQSTVTVVDADTRKRLADFLFPGRLGFGQSDGNGRIYVNITDRNAIASFSAEGLASRLRSFAQKDISGPALTVDWSDTASPTQLIPKALHVFRLSQDCESPRGLAIDSVNARLFAACDNMKMLVVNATDGSVVTSLPIGAGTDAIGFDPNHGLIYTSNGGGVGSLTIIRQHLTDSYAVIQELPTQARARTLAVNPDSGDVYLVTNVTGLDLTHNGGIGGLKTAPVTGSFEVLVIGN